MAATRPAETVMVRGVEISVFAHATEDEEKVERAVLNIIHMEAGANPKIQRMKGHYNDPITLITTKIKKRKAAQEVFHGLIRSLSPVDRHMLLDEVEDRVDNAGNLYLRLDKQNALCGKVILHEADPIHVKIKFRIPHRVDPVTAVHAYVASIIDEAENESGIPNRKAD